MCEYELLETFHHEVHQLEHLREQVCQLSDQHHVESLRTRWSCRCEMRSAQLHHLYRWSALLVRSASLLKLRHDRSAMSESLDHSNTS